MLQRAAAPYLSVTVPDGAALFVRSIPCGNEYIRFYQPELIPFQRQGYRREHISDAFRIGRSIPDEESAIRSQSGGILFQSPGTQSKTELLIQHFQYKCSICRAATQSGPRWDMLEQMEYPPAAGLYNPSRAYTLSPRGCFPLLPLFPYQPDAGNICRHPRAAGLFPAHLPRE